LGVASFRTLTRDGKDVRVRGYDNARQLKLNQKQFIQFWKSLYDVFQGQTNEQELYCAIGTIGTNLLRMGDAIRNVMMPSAVSQSDKQEKNEGSANPGENTDTTLGNTEIITKSKLVNDGMCPDLDPGVYDVTWSISFEDILMSISHFTDIYHYFDRRVEIRDRTKTVTAPQPE